MADRRQSGQALAEFALTMPALILLLFGMTLAGFYTFRAVAADWGVFISGVAEGAFELPTMGQVQSSIPWEDVRFSITTIRQPESRQASAEIGIRSSNPWVFGINLVEVHRGAAGFRLWRFYPGPPDDGGVE